MRSANKPDFKIRVANPVDAVAIAAIYAPIVRDTVISFEIELPTPQVMEERILVTLSMYPWLVAERDGEVVGYAYASKHRERAAYRWSVDVSAYVREGARGMGIGRALYDALIGMLRRQGFRSAFAGIALPNEASIRLHEAVGFQLVGVYRDVGFKHGHWRDVGWWRLGLTTGDAPPGEPISFPDLLAADSGLSG